MGPLEISGTGACAWRAGTGSKAIRAITRTPFRIRFCVSRSGRKSVSTGRWRLLRTRYSLLPRNAVVAAPQGQLGPGGTYYAANGNGRNNVNAFVKQAYVQFNQLGQGRLKLGRFEYFDGAEVKPKDATLAAIVQTRIAQRLIGNFSFSAVQRSYDGAQFHYALGKGDVTVFGARTTRGVYQIDGMGELDVDVYYGALTLPTGAEHSAGELRLFGLGYIDHRTSVLKTDNRPQASPLGGPRGDSNRNLRWRLPPRVQYRDRRQV